MAYIPRSSFIPKEATGAIPMQIKKRHSLHVFGLVSTLMIIGSLVTAVGAFFYKDYEQKQLQIAKDALQTESAQSADNAKKIEEIRRYDQKLKTASNLLGNHIAPSAIFSELESSTKETVQFKALELTYDPGFELMLTISGNSKELSSVALQKMQFFKDNLFTEFVVRDISLATEMPGTDGKTQPKETSSTDGKANFTITGIFDKKNVRYTGDTALSGVTTNSNTIPASDGTPVESNPATSTSNEITP